MGEHQGLGLTLYVAVGHGQGGQRSMCVCFVEPELGRFSTNMDFVFVETG